MWLWEMIKLGIWITIGIFVIAIVVTVVKARQTERRATELEARVRSKSSKYQGMPSLRGDSLVLMMHPQDRTAMIATGDGRTKELPFSAFLSAEIKEDGHAVTDTQRSGTLGRAAIGGVISGGTGAIIGALTAKQISTTREIVTHISIDVTTTDPEFPLLSWTIFAPVFGVEKMQPVEVEMQRKNAVALYNQLAPLFT
ncbi:hypothetical protein NBRC116598_41530 [Pseudophaeobacter arcticus]|uniref:Uncharacterized protein n=1 Tax=Pseudophaeobacter arcticus TaxID=385492 RepID=A0ABQ0AS49_9RHOB